jgi:hypothetical protein
MIYERISYYYTKKDGIMKYSKWAPKAKDKIVLQVLQNNQPATEL